ncbi:MAG: sensor histidine kinase [Lachnospiraceae bacterium]
MTLRKLWLIVLITLALVTIGINAMILAFLTDRYFSDYLIETYEMHVAQIIDYTTSALSSQEISYEQMAMELESHLTDPIIEIKLYSLDGEVLADVSRDDWMGNMMNSRRMGQMMNRTATEEVHQFDLISEGEKVGVIHITTAGLANHSIVAMRFKSSLLANSLISVGVAVIVSIILASIISRKMSRSLKETQRQASRIQLGEEVYFKESGIKEVDSIQSSLMELNTRLKLKQKTRKSLLDQLMHQTRTPLTILQSHIEAMEDGMIDLDETEFQVCQNQIQDLTAIIANMSSMIDAGGETDEPTISEFELYPMLSQMQRGLSAQFKKKRITFELKSDQKIQLKTDRFKLSQSIYNLLTNAYKYTQEGGTVKISYEMEKESIFIKVADTGIGISQSEHEKIFEAYYRGDAKQLENGQGIGLYIVAENISQLGGTIRVISETGRGSEFIICIPTCLETA